MNAAEFLDARLEELKLLSEIDRQGILKVSPENGPYRDLIAYLVHERFVNHLQPKPGTFSYRGSSGIPGESEFERGLHMSFLETLHRVLEGSGLELRLSHRGRVRLSELKQALRAGREREPFGILWDVRHWERDLQIAVLESSHKAPLTIAYLDMNGLKQINDKHGHDAGDDALKAYLQAVAACLGDGGQAYRLSGGADEVLVVLPNCDESRAVQTLRLACTKLMSERLWPLDPDGLLSIAAGLTINTEPGALPAHLRAQADDLQKRAKRESRKFQPRPSVIAIDGHNELTIIEHDEVTSPISITAEMSYEEGIEGLCLTVTNNGTDVLPPYDLGLCGPRVTLFFPSSNEGPLLRGQRRDHECNIIVNGEIEESLRQMMLDAGMNSIVQIEECDKCEIQIQLQDSDGKILFANQKVGRALARLLRSAVLDPVKYGREPDEWEGLL